MKIIFYNNKEENIVVKKENITPLFEIDGTLREGCSIYNPVIQIKTYGKDFTNNGVVQSIELANLIKANYAYVEDFSRYYYIDDIIGEYSNVATLLLKCDVLMSFKDYFKELNVFASRNEYNWKPTLCDEKIPAYGVRYNSIYELNELEFDNTGYCYTITLTTTVDNDNVTGAAYNYGFNGSTITTRTYVMSKKILNVVLKYITSNSLKFGGIFKDEPYQAVQSIKAFPFDITKYLDLTETKAIKIPTSKGEVDGYFLNFIGNELTIITANADPQYPKIYELSKGALTNVLSIEKLLSINLNLIYSDIDFINTNNYTRYKLFIPYYGVIDIDANYLFKYRSITVIYNIDVISGNTTIIVNSGIRYILTCNVGVDIPITGSNANEKTRNLIMNLIKTTGAIAGLGGVTSMVSVGGASTETTKYRYNKRGNVSSVKRIQTEEPDEQKRKFDFSKTANFISSNTIDIMNSLVNSNCGGNVGSDYSGYVYLLRKFILFVERVNYYVPNGYAHLVGRPTDYSGKLKGLFGYTEIAGVHIEGDMGSSSQSEKEEIEQALKTGVILPNPQSTTPSENETW